MKITDKQIQRLVRLVLTELKEQKMIVMKDKEEVLFQKGVALVRGDFALESQLDAEVHRMMDELERQNPGEFQRYKMFPLLKKKLAQQKGIVL